MKAILRALGPVFLAALVGCAGATTAVEEPNVASSATVTAAETVVAPPPSATRAAEVPDYTAQATRDATAVFEAMHPDLQACYAKRLAVAPNARAYMTFSVLIGEDGSVRDVATTGGANLGDATIKCLVERVERATFQPPHDGGTLRVDLPITFAPLDA